MGLAEGPQSLLDQGRVGQHPAVQGGVVDLQAALQEQLLNVTVAQGIAQVPGDGLQDQRCLEVPALEVVLRPALQLLGNRTQDHRPPPVQRRLCRPHAQRRVNAKTLRHARICYSTGPSGDHLKQLWERWGIAELVSQRAIQAPAGVPVGEIVAREDADLGFQQLSELLHVPGIEIVGPLPPEIQAVTVFSAGVSNMSPQREEACALVAYLTSPEAEAAKRQHGMEPA